MLECYSSTAVRQQKRHDRRSRSSIFGLLDRPSPQITDVLPLSMSTPQRSMILDSLAQHHVETCSTNFIVICVFNFLNTADAFCFAKVFRLFKIYTRK